ncbi:MAG: hypothetical protein ACR2PH_15480 [Desulfobulbia bacterium]
MIEFDTAVLVLIGAFIGWNFPQPPWAVWLQGKAVELFGKIKARFTK